MSAVPAVAPVLPPAGRPCPTCQREFGGGVACQFCDHVEGLPTDVHLASAGKRFGAYLLEGVLMIFTLFIGWLVWAAIVYSRGQTPAKQLLGMRVVDLRKGRKASWGKMFLRDVICKTVIGFLAVFTLYIIMFWLVWDKSKQELWDKMVGTIVVNDPNGQLADAAPAPTI